MGVFSKAKSLIFDKDPLGIVKKGEGVAKKISNLGISREKSEAYRMGEAAAALWKPGAVGVIIPGEGAAFVLARGLNDPSSGLFKLFTKGISAKTRGLWIKAAGISGQAVGRASEDEG